MSSSILNMKVDFLFAKLDKDGEYLRSVATLPFLLLCILVITMGLTSMLGSSAEMLSISGKIGIAFSIGFNILFLSLPLKLWKGETLRGRIGLSVLFALGWASYGYWLSQFADPLLRPWFDQQPVFATGDIARFGNGINDENIYDLSALCLGIVYVLLCSIVSFVVLAARTKSRVETSSTPTKNGGAA